MSLLLPLPQPVQRQLCGPRHSSRERTNSSRNPGRRVPRRRRPVVSLDLAHHRKQNCGPRRGHPACSRRLGRTPLSVPMHPWEKTSIVKVQGFKESMVSGCRIQQGVVGVGDLFIGWLHTRRLRLGLSRLCAAPRRGVDSGGTERPMCLHRFRCVARYRRAVPKPLTPIWCHSFSPSFRPHISRYFDIVCKHF